MSIKDLMQNPTETYLQWHEPWPGLDDQGKEVDAHMTYRASVKDCLALAKHARQHLVKGATIDDEDLLAEFMAVHFASPIGFCESPRYNWLLNLIVEANLNLKDQDAELASMFFVHCIRAAAHPVMMERFRAANWAGDFRTVWKRLNTPGNPVREGLILFGHGLLSNEEAPG